MPEEKSRILIVDDERSNIHMLGTLLADNYDISVAMSGEQALRLIATGLHLDLILLDIQMPNMSGADVTRAIRGGTCGDATVPIVAVTASAEAALHEEYRQAGINGVLLKPVSPEHLQAELSRWLSR